METMQSSNRGLADVLTSQIASSLANLPIATLEKTVTDKMGALETSTKAASDSFETKMANLMQDCISGCRTSYMACERLLQQHGKALAVLLNNGKINMKQFDVMSSDLTDAKTGITKIFTEMMKKFNPFQT